ncbi:MAG: hypothetical protein ERJ68_06605 [Aphanocapsa feldmannii 277cI]|uniref:Cyanovirin-N domain-containing protein n=1 Tax=Aphanocapsa feldmannii 277cI TaxID=2507554 RepID=A0A524RTV7_9CHRO|nr:MAG: hypothetical protein ERJ68_06605 [Aphanocapsa feldmannii 277cI]
MTWNSTHAIPVAVVLALTAAFAGQAHAGSCEGGQRIDHKEADCLDADWDNDIDFWSTSKVEATNKCPSYGTVVAKVDIKAATDYTLYLKDGTKKTKKSGAFNIRNVYCCADLSDLCNKSDIINDDSCLARFMTSSADDSCRNASSSVNGSDMCVITAECENRSSSGHSWGYFRTSITASWQDTANLHNCRGELKIGLC